MGSVMAAVSLPQGHHEGWQGGTFYLQAYSADEEPNNCGKQHFHSWRLSD